MTTEQKLFDLSFIHQVLISALPPLEFEWIYNGCALWTKDGQIIYCCRARDRDPVRTSYVVIWEFDSEFVPKRYPRLLPIITNLNHLEATQIGSDPGPQDARIFYAGERLGTCIVFNMLVDITGKRMMYLYSLDQKQKPLRLSIRNAVPRHVEKNWTPFWWRGMIHFIYSFVPLVVLALTDTSTGECSVIYAERVPAAPQYRGGSPAIETTKNVFEGFLHTTIPIPDGRRDGAEGPDGDLPGPAAGTLNRYRCHKFTLDCRAGNKLNVSIGPELDFFGRQIEQIYGWDPSSNQAIVNVNDKNVVLVKDDPRLGNETHASFDKLKT